MTNFPVICVNDSDKPDGIPDSKWVKKGSKYTVIEVGKLNMQNGLIGFKLAELNIDSCFPYQFFAASRFGIPQPDKKAKNKKNEELVLETT